MKINPAIPKSGIKDYVLLRLPLDKGKEVEIIVNFHYTPSSRGDFATPGTDPLIEITNVRLISGPSIMDLLDALHVEQVWEELTRLIIKERGYYYGN